MESISCFVLLEYYLFYIIDKIKQNVDCPIIYILYLRLFKIKAANLITWKEKIILFPRFSSQTFNFLHAIDFPHHYSTFIIRTIYLSYLLVIVRKPSGNAYLYSQNILY